MCRRMEFCPRCANLLQYGLPHRDRPTCPYVYDLEGKVVYQIRVPQFPILKRKKKLGFIVVVRSLESGPLIAAPRVFAG